MIAACPKCAARYRIDASRLRPEGARVRCSRCEAVFRVRAGGALAGPEASREPEAAEPLEAARPPGASGERPVVLVADSSVEAGKATAGALAQWGLDAILVHDGVEAILTIQRTLPRAVVLDAGLPKMFGFQICELMKRNDSLRAIQVVLVGAIHHRERYRRSPSELYGADAYVERPQLPGALRSILGTFGLPLAEEPEGPVGGTPPAAEIAAVPGPAPAEPAPAPPDDLVDEVARAERLARIAVSDIVLYHPEKFDAAVRSGDIVRAMDSEMREARDLFASRIDERVRDLRDFLGEELLRVARQREGT